MNTPKKSELLAWFEELISTRYGTMKNLAKAAHRGAGALKRSAETTGSVGLEPLLLLAEDTGESASDVLRRANKDDMDALIRRLYGRPVDVLPADVQRVVDVLMSDEPGPAAFRAWVKQTAAEWSALTPPRGRTTAPVDETPATASGKRRRPNALKG